MTQPTTHSQDRFFTLLATVLVFGLYAVFPACERAAPNAYYVALNGNDSSPGTLTAPFRTIQHCLNAVQAGDACFIKAGTYNEALVLRASGTKSARITLGNYNGEVVTIYSGDSQTLRTGGRRHYYTIEGLRFTANHQYYKDSDATLQFGEGIWDGSSTRDGGDNGFVIRHCYVEGGIQFYGHDNVVEYCELNGRQQWGNGIRDQFGSSHDNIYRDNLIYGYTRRGIWSIQYTDGIVIERNTIHNINGIGIDLDGAGSPVYNSRIVANTVYEISPGGSDKGTGIALESAFNAVIEKNMVHDVSAVGIGLINYGPDIGDGEYRDDDLNTVVRNNLIYDTDLAGILGAGAPGVKVYNNTIYNNRGSLGYFAGIALTSYGGFYCHNWDIENNIVSESNPYAVYVDAPTSGLTGLRLNNNLYYHSSKTNTHQVSSKAYTLSQYQQATGQEGRSLFAQPKFVNLAIRDMHLQMTSPAIDAGVDVGLYEDLDGNSRPQGAGYDIGACEYIGSRTLTLHLPLALSLATPMVMTK